MIQNPILPGFHPDPSMIRVNDDYYIVTSSFEWFPGIPLYHSRDLVHWKLVRNLLNTKEYLDLTGVSPSKGVWAPGLSYCREEERFYLVYSNVHTKNNWMFDVDNYLIWTDDLLGEWSKPLYLNSSGFDPYLFHDGDGRKWLLNKDRDFRPDNMDSRTIVIQEFSADQGALVGTPVSISSGMTGRGFVEGPVLYKKDAWYYLFLAEGGTGYGHCVTMGRSRSVTGPYEPCPHNPVLTSSPGDFTASEERPFMQPELYNPSLALQKAGHGTLVQTQDGRWYMAHLCGRPVLPQMRCVLGRETAIQQMQWTPDGWLRVADGTSLPKDRAPAPDLPLHPFPDEAPRCDFSGGVLPPQFCTVRNEILPDWVQLSAGDAGLRLRGRESTASNFALSLIARRLTAFRAKICTLLRFEPESYHHLAGITCYYDSSSHYCAYKTYDDRLQSACLTLYGFVNGRMISYDVSIAIPADAPVYLRADIDLSVLRFFYSLDGKAHIPLGPELDMTVLSDEAGSDGIFTGTFVGMFAQDTRNKSKWAGFDFFEYLPEASAEL